MCKELSYFIGKYQTSFKCLLFRFITLKIDSYKMQEVARCWSVDNTEEKYLSLDSFSQNLLTIHYV